MNLEALVRATVARNNGSVRDQRIVNTGEGNQVRLELVQVDI